MTNTEPKCPACQGKRYIIAERDDERVAVERCDACQDEHLFSDEDAALLARADGVKCSLAYPCILEPFTVYAVVKLEIANRGPEWVPDGWTVENVIAGYLQGAFGNALAKCDTQDRIVDLSVFGDTQTAADRAMLEDLLK